MRKVIIKHENISQLWVFGVVLIYGLVLSEYFNNFSKKVIIAQGQFFDSPFFTYIVSFNFFFILLMTFAIWLITTLLFHMFAILMGGESTFKDFQKLTGLCYFFPTIGFLVAYFLFERIQLPKENLIEFFESDKSMFVVNWIINGSSWLYCVLLIPIIKYLYQIHWLKAMGAIVVPFGSIYFLGQFFATYII